MVKKWDLIYELRADKKRVRQVQEERAKGEGFSYSPYLFGSKQWWEAIDAGSIERRIEEGTITEAKPTSMPDRQEFRMRTADGSELTGLRHGDAMRYVEGLRIRFEYVSLQRSPEFGATADDVVIAVWIEHSHRRTPFLHSFYPSPPAPII
jgi:hypothetical protein